MSDLPSDLVDEPSREATGDGRPPESIAEARRNLRSLMWELVGIVRTDARLEEAERELSRLADENGGCTLSPCNTTAAIEFRNLIECALLIVRCAMWRKESRGLHFNSDHPDVDDRRFLTDSVAVGMIEAT